jgi:AcrR family transcriptional regulator
MASSSATMPPVGAVGDEACESPRRGRPRSAEVDQNVLAAALELAGEVGVVKMSMDDLAERAGVSKATVYRRWSSKEALILDALRSAINPIQDVDTGVLRRDLELYLGELARRFRTGKLGDALPHLIEVSCHDEALRSSLDEYVQSRRVPLRRIIDRAIERGELSGAIDAEVLLDTLIAPFMYRHLMSRQPIDAGFVDDLLAIVLPSP